MNRIRRTKRYQPSWFSRLGVSETRHANHEHFTSAFWREVEGFRQKFHLTNSEFGVDIPLNVTECWQPYIINSREEGLEGIEVLAAVSRFEWNRIESSIFESNRNYPDVPRFRLTMHFALSNSTQRELGILGKPKPLEGLDLPAGHIHVHSCTLTIEYSSRHPLEQPWLYSEAEGVMEWDPHQHHWYADGRLCITPSSSTDQGWERYGQSTVRWLSLAVAWNIWHAKTYGF